MEIKAFFFVKGHNLKPSLRHSAKKQIISPIEHLVNVNNEEASKCSISSALCDDVSDNLCANSAKATDHVMIRLLPWAGNQSSRVSPFFETFVRLQQQ